MNRPKRVQDWAGGYVKSLRSVRTGLAELPAGTIYKVESAGVTARFSSLPCPCCGIRHRYTDKTKHKFDDVEWLGYELPDVS